MLFWTLKVTIVIFLPRVVITEKRKMFFSVKLWDLFLEKYYKCFLGRLRFPTFECKIIQNKETKNAEAFWFLCETFFLWNFKIYVCKHKCGVCVFYVQFWKHQFPNLINFWHGIIIYGETEWFSQCKRKCQSA